ncbi:hypothetical protein ACVW16_001238 [Bradyrhizobium sp. USDA 4474]
MGDKDHIKVFTTVDAAEKWFEENDLEDVAFEYDLIEDVGPLVNRRAIFMTQEALRKQTSSSFASMNKGDCGHVGTY